MSFQSLATSQVAPEALPESRVSDEGRLINAAESRQAQTGQGETAGGKPKWCKICPLALFFNATGWTVPEVPAGPRERAWIRPGGNRVYIREPLRQNPENAIEGFVKYITAERR